MIYSWKKRAIYSPLETTITYRKERSFGNNILRVPTPFNNKVVRKQTHCLIELCVKPQFSQLTVEVA